MAVTAGTYVIVAAEKPTLALDLIGAYDTSGTRLELWSRNDGDAQLIRLLPAGSYWYMQFILTGKCVDRTNNGTANGTVVEQWDMLSNDAQKWRFVADGKTVTVGGVAYPSYIIKHPTLEMALDITGGTLAEGTNLQLWEVNAGTAQRWLLIPQNAVADGTYKIFTPLKTSMLLDIAGASTAQGANVWLWSDLDYNTQKWVVKTDRTTGLSTLKNPVTGYLLDNAEGSTENGANVQVYGDTNSDAQKWVIEPDETRTATVNGQPVALYRLLMKNGSRRAADVANGGTELGTNVRLWEQNGALAQLFGFVPTEYTADNLPVPCPEGASLNKCDFYTMGTTFTVKDGAAPELWPAFSDTADTYQLRYRMRTRTASMDDSDLGEWGEWQSIADGSTSNEGWGDVWSENCKPYKKSATRWAGPIQCPTVAATGTDRVEYQYEVRRFAATWGAAGGCAHGNSASRIFRAVIKPTVTVSSVTVTPEGLAISYTSSFPRGNNTVKASCPGLFDQQRATGLAAEDALVVPLDELARIPEEGESLTVKLTLITTDGASVTITAKATASFDGEHGTSLTYTHEQDGTVDKFKMDGEGAAYLVVERGHGNRMVKFDTDEDGAVSVVPPLNTPYTVYLMKGSVEDGGAWATKKLSMPAVESYAYHITSLDGSKDVSIELNEGEPPTFSPSYARDLSFATTTGRERSVATMGTTTTATWSLSGVFYGTWNGTLLEHDRAFDLASHMGFCIFRAPNTFWAQAAMTGSSCDMGGTNVHSASFSFKEIEV